MSMDEAEKAAIIAEAEFRATVLGNLRELQAGHETLHAALLKVTNTLHESLHGSGNLVVRVDRLEQSRDKQDGWIKAIGVAVIGMVTGGLGLILKEVFGVK